MGKKSDNLPEKIWQVYWLECDNGSIYTGISNDVPARFLAHLTGKGAKYTRMHPPKRLLATQSYDSHSLAAKAEFALKKLSVTQKRAMIAKISNNKPVS